MEGTTTISQKGQIVLPKIIRDKLKIKASDTLKVKLEDTKIIVEKASTIDDFYGFIEGKKAVNKKDIKDAFQKAIKDKF